MHAMANPTRSAKKSPRPKSTPKPSQKISPKSKSSGKTAAKAAVGKARAGGAGKPAKAVAAGKSPAKGSGKKIGAVAGSAAKKSTGGAAKPARGKAVGASKLVPARKEKAGRQANGTVTHAQRGAGADAGIDAEIMAGLLPRLREICLALPETTEVEAWGHPTFRVNNKIFAGVGVEGTQATLGVKTTPDMQAALVSSDPRFTVAAYVGQHGWVSLSLSGTVDLGEVEMLVRGSYRLVAPARLVRQLDEAVG